MLAQQTTSRLYVPKSHVASTTIRSVDTAPLLMVFIWFTHVYSGQGLCISILHSHACASQSLINSFLTPQRGLQSLHFAVAPHDLLRGGAVMCRTLPTCRVVYWSKKSDSMYSTIGSGTASQATPQGRRHKRAEVGFELAIRRLPARRLDR